MKIFITGTESFIGSTLWTELESAGYELSGIDVAERVRNGSIRMDLRDPNLVDVIPEGAKVIHLAALSTDGLCSANQHEALGVNVGGTVNLIGAAIRRKSPQFVFASTEWVYGDVENDGIQLESDQLDLRGIKSYYALTKKIGEEIIAVSRLDCSTILRFGIVYGLRKANFSAVEKICEMAAGGAISVGCLQTGRRFIHVRDLCEGIIASLRKGLPGIFNLSGDTIVTLAEIARVCQGMVKKHVQIHEDAAGKMSRRNPCNNKARQCLEWEPKVPLGVGLGEILEAQK
jgi:nucleoside-diphosphate-sugar epimerase